MVRPPHQDWLGRRIGVALCVAVAHPINILNHSLSNLWWGGVSWLRVCLKLVRLMSHPWSRDRIHPSVNLLGFSHRRPQNCHTGFVTRWGVRSKACSRHPAWEPTRVKFHMVLIDSYVFYSDNTYLLWWFQRFLRISKFKLYSKGFNMRFSAVGTWFIAIQKRLIGDTLRFLRGRFRVFNCIEYQVELSRSCFCCFTRVLYRF